MTSVVGSCFMMLMIKCAIEMTYNSQEYINSYLRNDNRLTKQDLAFFKSCMILKYRIGDMFTISTRNYPMIYFGNIIMSTVIHLLLTFK